MFDEIPLPLEWLDVLMLLVLLRLLKSSSLMVLLIKMSESMFWLVLAIFKQTLRGTVQCRLAEKIASGPSRLNGSSTLYTVKSGSVSVKTNLDDA